jgi:hypothetical protein
MSLYLEMVTEFSDVDCLKRALEELGFKGHVEVHQTAQNLYGYHGDVRSQKAHVIIRRQFIGGSSNDIGFEKQLNGTYKAIISEYDEKCGYNSKWLGKLKQAYTVEKIAKEAVRSGRTITKTKDKSGKIRMVLVKA